MDAIGKILSNLQKYATTVIPIKVDVNSVTPLLPEKRSLEKVDLDKDTSGSEIGANAATPEANNTKECLKEFDDILKEINKDVSKGTSLDDMEEVLKDVAQEDSKDFMIEVPRFDFAEILAAFENLEDDAEITDNFLSLGDSNVSLSDDYNDVIEQTDAISISSDDSQPEGSVMNISTENNKNIDQSIDINLTNTKKTKDNIKQSQSIECEKLSDTFHLVSAEKNENIGKQISLNVKTNKVIDKTNEPTDKIIEGIQRNSVESRKEINDLTTKDVVNMDDSDDVGYHSSDFEFITEEQAKMNGLIINNKKNTHKRKYTTSNRVKTIKAAIDSFSNGRKSLRRNKMKRKTRNIDADPDWAPKSDTDSISDDEIIPEYISRNHTRSKNDYTPPKNVGRNKNMTFRLRQIRIPPKTNNGSPKFVNLQINSETITSKNTTVENVDVIKNNDENDHPEQNNDQEFNNECRNKLITIKMDCNDESNLLQIGLRLEQQNCPDENSNKNLPGNESDSIEIIPGSSFMQVSHSLTPTYSSNGVLKSNEVQDEPELNNIAGPTQNSPGNNNVNPVPSERPGSNITPSTSTENVIAPDSIKLGPSEMQENLGLNNWGPGPSFIRKRSYVDDIEKWRMYQMRNRLNRPQFVVDYSYRAHHRICQNNELHQMFDPNRAPLPTARSIRMLENKSTVCKNSMLVEYQGMGFEVPMMDSGSEDEVKQEANECSRKIREMYPEENTRRQRHRRF